MQWVAPSFDEIPMNAEFTSYCDELADEEAVAEGDDGAATCESAS